MSKDNAYFADPHYAAEYLAQALAEKDSTAFLIALKDVAEASCDEMPVKSGE